MRCFARGFRLLWLAFGNLNNGSGNASLSCLNGNNGLSNGNWNYLARLSDTIKINALHGGGGKQPHTATRSRLPAGKIDS